jgi:sec-independent protein translocase protein TatB
MFDFSWSELALIAAVALIVIGPKDLPRALRTAGMWARKARTISREFQSSIEQMVREAELDDVKKEIEAATSLNLENEIKNTIDPTGSLAESLKAPELTATPSEPTPSIAAPALSATEAPPAIAPPLPDPETSSAEPVAAPPPHEPSHPSPETQHLADAEGDAKPVPSHSGGTS